ncbi:hypothetical protein SAMN04488061_3385 [Filomicrobium insigne]|uniref:Uncharacterized protein n=1 Tax=Filomicrobium insigne TaxID=418854 RepID=A0A1H0TV12_9HYPH|nr:hypothetical protein SAMN04488061_3385 [Filomicrobium insigne]
MFFMGTNRSVLRKHLFRRAVRLNCKNTVDNVLFKGWFDSYATRRNKHELNATELDAYATLTGDGLRRTLSCGTELGEDADGELAKC